MSVLKRLDFVKGYAAQGVGIAESIYKTARGFVPSFVEPYAKQLEETALNVAAPYLTLAQDSAEKVLVTVDTQVMHCFFVLVFLLYRNPDGRL